MLGLPTTLRASAAHCFCGPVDGDGVGQLATRCQFRNERVIGLFGQVNGGEPHSLVEVHAAATVLSRPPADAPNTPSPAISAARSLAFGKKKTLLPVDSPDHWPVHPIHPSHDALLVRDGLVASGIK